MRRLLAAMVCLWAAMPVCAGPFRAVDGRGVLVSLPAAPRRIVSLIPSATELVFALGLGKSLVGVTTYCDYPPEAARIAKIGDLNTSIEKVLALRPDLVVASSSGNRVALARLEQLKLQVYSMDPVTMDALFANMRSLGDLTGTRPRADRLVANMERRFAAVARRVRGLPRVRTLMVLGLNPLWVAGSANFMDTVVRTAGGTNICARRSGYGQWSLEQVIAAPPEAILTTTDKPSAFRNQGAWLAVAAVRSGRIYPLGYETVRPGPRLADAAERIARALHPEAFRR